MVGVDGDSLTSRVYQRDNGYVQTLWLKNTKDLIDVSASCPGDQPLVLKLYGNLLMNTTGITLRSGGGSSRCGQPVYDYSLEFNHGYAGDHVVFANDHGRGVRCLHYGYHRGVSGLAPGPWQQPALHRLSRAF